MDEDFDDDIEKSMDELLDVKFIKLLFKLFLLLNVNLQKQIQANSNP